MRTRMVLVIALAALLVGLAAGILIGHESDQACPACPDCQAEQPGNHTGPVTAHQPVKKGQSKLAVATGDEKLKDDLQRLKAQTEMQKAMMQGMHQEKYGEPLSWYKIETPEMHKPAKFVATMEELGREIAASKPLNGLTYLFSDCKEPPCFGVWKCRPMHERKPDMIDAVYSGPEGSKGWKARFGRDSRSVYIAKEVACEDGRREWLVFASPDFAGLKTAFDPENLKKRLDARAQEIATYYKCR